MHCRGVKWQRSSHDLKFEPLLSLSPPHPCASKINHYFALTTVLPTCPRDIRPQYANVDKQQLKARPNPCNTLKTSPDWNENSCSLIFTDENGDSTRVHRIKASVFTMKALTFNEGLLFTKKSLIYMSHLRYSNDPHTIWKEVFWL